MKTLASFISEATEKDLKQMGASDSAIAELKRRKEKRGYGFDSKDDRAKGGALALRDKNAITKTKSSALAKKGSSALTTTEKTPKKKRETVSNYVPRAVTPDKKAATLDKKKEDKKVFSKDKKKEDDKKDGEGLELGKKAGWLKNKVKQLNVDTNKPVDTYHATPIA